MRSEHTWRSNGYNFKFIGHANVKEIRILYRTEPYGKIRMYTLGIMILWKCPSFSFEKNKSGIHTRFASVSVRYFKRPTNCNHIEYIHRVDEWVNRTHLPPISSNFKRWSVHCSRNVNCTLYSYKVFSYEWSAKSAEKRNSEISAIYSIAEAAFVYKFD